VVSHPHNAMGTPAVSPARDTTHGSTGLEGKKSGDSRRSYLMVFIGLSGSAKATGGGGFRSLLQVGVRQLRGFSGDQMASCGGDGFSSSS
jgi:hypothetical protein